MKILTLKSALFLVVIFLFYNTNLIAQEDGITLEQNSKFEILLNEKRKINTSLIVNELYKIQIYKGDSETSKKTLADFKRDFKNYDATIIFSTPSYKVLIGNIRSRIEAERSLIEIKKKYQAAIIIKS